MATVSINGITFRGDAAIIIRNGRVIVDGRDVTPDVKEVTISVAGIVDEVHFTGYVHNVSVVSCGQVTVHGGVGNISLQSGEVVIEGNVSGRVSTNTGNVHCRSVYGGVSTLTGDVYLNNESQ